MAKLGQQVSFAGNLGTGQAYQDAVAAASAASQRLSSWKTGTLAPVDRNIVTGALRPAVPMFVQDAIRGVMAPGKAMRGEYGLTASPDGRVSYDGMAEDAAALAGTVTLGAGAIPRPAGSLDMGMRVFHGSPQPNLGELRQSTRGPLGPGVYATPQEGLAQRYARDGTVYSFDAPDEIFHGMRPWMSGSDVNPYQIWREQSKKLVDAVPDDKKQAVSTLLDRMSYDDGYPFFARLSQLVGGDKQAQDLLKKAGFKGMTAFVDGPEMVLFDEVSLAPR